MKNFLKLVTAAVFVMLFASSLYAADNNLSNKILFVEKEKAGSTYLSVMDPNGANKKRLTPSMFNIVFLAVAYPKST